MSPLPRGSLSVARPGQSPEGEGDLGWGTAQPPPRGAQGPERARTRILGLPELAYGK